MVLNAKAMEWAGGFGIDSAKLKNAKVKIFGKWYFPDMPANQRLINLQTGDVETFPTGLRAGTVLYVLEAELKQAKLGPFAEPAAEVTEASAESTESKPAKESA
jgi:hypothetical protein